MYDAVFLVIDKSGPPEPLKRGKAEPGSLEKITKRFIDTYKVFTDAESVCRYLMDAGWGGYPELTDLGSLKQVTPNFGTAMTWMCGNVDLMVIPLKLHAENKLRFEQHVRYREALEGIANTNLAGRDARMLANRARQGLGWQILN